MTYTFDMFCGYEETARFVARRAAELGVPHAHNDLTVAFDTKEDRWRVFTAMRRPREILFTMGCK